MTNINKLFGFVMIQNHENSRIIFTKINQKWCINQVDKNLYDALKSLYDKNLEIDLLSVTQELRNLKKYSTVILLTLSKSISEANGFAHIDSILNVVDYEYKVRELQIYSQELTQEVNSVNMSTDAIISLNDKMKQMLVDNIDTGELTNHEIILEVIERHDKSKNGEEIGVELGWQSLRQKVVLEDVDVMVVGGRPAMGKTAWMISAIKKLAFDQNKKVAIFSLEMSKAQLMRRLLALLSGIDSNKIKFGNCTEAEIEIIYSIQKLPEFDNVIFYDGSHTVTDITKHVTQLKNSSGLDVYMIDYLQKIIPNKSNNRYQEVTQISNDIKRLTMGVKIPCIALAQLSRDSARTGKRPTLPDLKESGDIEQDASIVAFLHRPEYYGENCDENGDSTIGKGEFLIAKNREGVTGIFEMNVDLKISSWNDNASFETPKNPEYKQTDLTQFTPTEENPF